MFNNILDTKQTFLGHKKINISKSQNRIFPNGLTYAFGNKQLNISKSQKSHFSKGVNPWFWSKNAPFFLSVFGQNKTRKTFNNVLDTNKLFLAIKN